MQSSHQNQDSLRSRSQNLLPRPLLSPFVAKTLEVEGDSGFPFGAAHYNQRHNLIIACPLDRTIQFYDATSLLPIKGRKALKVDRSVVQMSFHPETDTYLLGCTAGSMYKYNASRNQLKKLKVYGKQVAGITFLDSNFYFFTLLDSKKLYVGTLDDDNVFKVDRGHPSAFGLHHINKRNLLFSGLTNGDVRVYRTSKLPLLQAICSAHTGEWVSGIHSLNINGKEYVVTSSKNQPVKIWHLTKGRMRLLKVIHTEGVCPSSIYFEQEKMIVIGDQSNEIKFLRFPSMRLEKAVRVSHLGVHHLFSMKEKGLIGVRCGTGNRVEFIQLYP